MSKNIILTESQFKNYIRFCKAKLNEWEEQQPNYSYQNNSNENIEEKNLIIYFDTFDDNTINNIFNNENVSDILENNQQNLFINADCQYNYYYADNNYFKIININNITNDAKNLFQKYSSLNINEIYNIIINNANNFDIKLIFEDNNIDYNLSQFDDYNHLEFEN